MIKKVSDKDAFFFALIIQNRNPLPPGYSEAIKNLIVINTALSQYAF